MKLDAVGVISSNIPKTIEFYKLLGFEFSEMKADEQHIEPITSPGSARLMIDSIDVVRKIVGENPRPGNISAFAIKYDTIEELNKVSENIQSAGFTVFKEPWDAFWGQRYAVVQDPDGYRVDLFAYLKK